MVRAFTCVDKTCFYLLSPVSIFLSLLAVTSMPHVAPFRVSSSASGSIAFPRLCGFSRSFELHCHGAICLKFSASLL